MMATEELVPTLKQKRRFKEMVGSFQQAFPSDADLILQTSIKKQDAALLAALLEQIQPKSVLEIGSYCGVSTRWFLTCLPEAELTCVDPWLSEGVVNTAALFNHNTHFAADRITKIRAYFASRNNQAFSVTTSRHNDHSTRPGDYARDLPLHVPQRPYDLVFVDGDHRTTSSITAFMLCKEVTDHIIYHDANLDTHRATFSLVEQEWAGEWQVQHFSAGEDGLALLKRIRSNTP